jgi:Protein of unknown function (DUF3684)
VVELVYKIGSEKPSVTSKTDILKSSSHKASGFFSPLSNGFEASPTPQGTPTQAPAVHNESIYLLEANSLNIVLTIFAANVDVRLDKKMAGELLRATKKNPPSRLRYELIYVSFYCGKAYPQNGFLLLQRRGRTNMTRASGRKRKRYMIPGACFKGFGLIWKGSSHHSEHTF